MLKVGSLPCCCQRVDLKNWSPATDNGTPPQTPKHPQTWKDWTPRGLMSAQLRPVIQRNLQYNKHHSNTDKPTLMLSFDMFSNQSLPFWRRSQASPRNASTLADLSICSICQASLEAPNRALKRRVRQRLHKKLGSMLTCEEPPWWGHSAIVLMHSALGAMMVVHWLYLIIIY